jgi:hypothetical protein
MLKYDAKLCNQFVKNMKCAGLKTEHYHGRNFWQGPAVRCDNLQDVMSNTKVPCQWDNMGLGYIVYPRQAGRLLEESVKSEKKAKGLAE